MDARNEKRRIPGLLMGVYVYNMVAYVRAGVWELYGSGHDMEFGPH